MHRRSGSGSGSVARVLRVWSKIFPFGNNLEPTPAWGDVKGEPQAKLRWPVVFTRLSHLAPNVTDEIYNGATRTS